MALIKPDFSEVSEISAVQPGTYNARIINAEAQTSKAGGAMINWKLELFGNPEINGRTVFSRTMVSGKGAFRLQELYKAALGQTLEGAFDTDDLLGKELIVTLVPGKSQDGSPSNYPDVKSFTALN